MSKTSDPDFSISAKAHWEYVKKVIKLHAPNTSDEVLDMIGFHYQAAMTHGYKHGKQDK